MNKFFLLPVDISDCKTQTNVFVFIQPFTLAESFIGAFETKQ